MKTSMITLRRLLCPVDFSDFSKQALDLAMVIARWYEAEIVVVHVVPIVPTVLPFPSATIPDVGALDPQVAGRELQSFVEAAGPAPPRPQTIVRMGAPAPVILDLAREVNADLLVLGTHGRTGFERLMLGSVTEKVMLKATCPVLTVPRAVDGGAQAPVFRRIVCGMDFSEAALRGLKFALSLCAEAGGHLTLLHAVEWMPEASLPGLPEFDLKQFGASLVSEAQSRLEQLVPAETRDWCEINSSVRIGKPYVEILRTAAEESTDLIVLGVQGRGPLDRMLFGSTTQHVVRKAPCPVLTVRP